MVFYSSEKYKYEKNNYFYIFFICTIIISFLSGCNPEYNTFLENNIVIKKSELKSESFSNIPYLDYKKNDEYTWKSLDGRVCFTIDQDIFRHDYGFIDKKYSGVYFADGCNYDMIVGFDEAGYIYITSLTTLDSQHSSFYFSGLCFYGEYFGYQHNSIIVLIDYAESNGVFFYDSDEAIVLTLSY